MFMVQNILKSKEKNSPHCKPKSFAISQVIFQDKVETIPVIDKLFSHKDTNGKHPFVGYSLFTLLGRDQQKPGRRNRYCINLYLDMTENFVIVMNYSELYGKPS